MDSFKGSRGIGKISTQINPDKQSQLVLRLSVLASEDKEHTDAYLAAIEQIKTATGRRFLKKSPFEREQGCVKVKLL